MGLGVWRVEGNVIFGNIFGKVLFFIWEFLNEGRREKKNVKWLPGFFLIGFIDQLLSVVHV